MNLHADRDDDLLTSYIEGDPEAVRAAAPREPDETAWEESRLKLHAKLDAHREHSARHRRGAMWLAASAVLSAAAAAVAWMAFQPSAPKDLPARETVVAKPRGEVPVVAPVPSQADPLADIAVLPVASNNEVVLHRVPGEGWLPVGTPPFSGELSLATSDDVAIDEPNPAWPSVTITPGAVPMIFAAKPR